MKFIICIIITLLTGCLNDSKSTGPTSQTSSNSLAESSLEPVSSLSNTPINTLSSHTSSSSLIHLSSSTALNEAPESSSSQFLSQSSALSSVAEMVSSISKLADSTSSFSSEIETSSSSMILSNSSELVSSNERTLLERCLDNTYQLPKHITINTQLHEKIEEGDFYNPSFIPGPDSISLVTPNLGLNGLPLLNENINNNANIETWWDPTYAAYTKDTTLTFLTNTKNVVFFNQNFYFPLAVSTQDTLGWLNYKRYYLTNPYNTLTPDEQAHNDSLLTLSDPELLGYYAARNILDVDRNIFTTHMSVQFLYNGSNGQYITGYGDDDLLAYVNDSLILDRSGFFQYGLLDTIFLDTFFLNRNTQVGDTLTISVFHADRGRSDSSIDLRMKLNCLLFDK